MADDFQSVAAQFLSGLKRSASTLRAYRADLSHLQRRLRYAQVSDASADTEFRKSRRSRK